jgi:hypothetical protein
MRIGMGNLRRSYRKIKVKIKTILSPVPKAWVF